MTTFDEITDDMATVLSDGEPDDLLIEFRSHQPDVEFADLSEYGMLYNVAALDDEMLKDELDRRLDIHEVDRGDNYVTFAYYGEQSLTAYADVLDALLTTLDLRTDDISSTTLRSLN